MNKLNSSRKNYIGVGRLNFIKFSESKSTLGHRYNPDTTKRKSIYQVLLSLIIGVSSQPLNPAALSASSWCPSGTWKCSLESSQLNWPRRAVPPTRLHPCSIASPGLRLLLSCNTSLLMLAQGGSRMAKMRGTCFPTTKSLLQAGRQSSGNRRLSVTAGNKQQRG